jgi:hypothetical protein
VSRVIASVRAMVRKGVDGSSPEEGSLERPRKLILGRRDVEHVLRGYVTTTTPTGRTEHSRSSGPQASATIGPERDRTPRPPRRTHPRIAPPRERALETHQAGVA